jgi:hypothetical protein
VCGRSGVIAPGWKECGIETAANLCKETSMKTVTIECPDRMHDQLARLVEAGWFKTTEDVALEAVRRYLSGHSLELQEQQIKADVEWGLHGRD